MFSLKNNNVFIFLLILMGVSVLHAAPESKTESLSKQREILGLAKARHDLAGQNIDLRSQIIDVEEVTSTANFQTQKAKVLDLVSKMQQNRQKIKELEDQIKAQWEILKKEKWKKRSGHEAPIKETQEAPLE